MEISLHNIAVNEPKTTMSDSYSIEAPVTLFTLPQPSNSSSKGQQAGPSHSISGSRKRKRTEIVVGSDGETVNVYDVC